MPQKIFIAIFILLLPDMVFSQLNNDMLKYNYEIDEADSNTLWLGVRALGFNKNNEYFNKITDGYTLFGYQFSPYFSYRPGGHIKIDAGIYLQQDLGNKSISTIQPVFTIKYLEGNHSITFGSLENSYNHGLIEPLYNFEKGLIDRQEFGVQANFDLTKIWLDTWLSWENMIYKNDPEQEVVNLGISSRYKIIHNSEHSFSIPGQLIVYHKGGQIDINPNPLSTFTNYAIGFKYEKFTSGWINSWSGENYIVGYTDFSFEKRQFYTQGNGIYLNLGAKLNKGVEVLASYWHGRGYTPIIGGELYSSQSFTVHNPNYTEDTRDLLIMRFFYNKNIGDGLQVSIRFEPYYDVGNSTFEFSHGMYLNFNSDFLLAKITKKH